MHEVSPALALSLLLVDRIHQNRTPVVHARLLSGAHLHEVRCANSLRENAMWLLRNRVSPDVATAVASAAEGCGRDLFFSSHGV